MTIEKKYLWMVFLGLGIVGFLITWFLLPHRSEIDSIWTLVFKMVIYGFIIGAIAFFPNQSKYGYLLVIAPFFVFLGFIIPKISWFGFTGIIPNADYSLSGEFYTILYLLLVPLINFSVSFAYRMGGGSSGNTLKISLFGIILLFSGYLDILWHIVNPVEIPDRLLYAHHITVFFGRTVTFTEAIIFAICHLPLLVAVLLLPFDKWINAVFSYDEKRKKPIEQAT
ncbi:MAG: hypothetical protein GXY86_11365 [Firmicutes bacterium]|nr:hypothetical protein [Bacillota bacterium]